MIALLTLPQVQGVERAQTLHLEYQNQSLQTQAAHSVFAQAEQYPQAKTVRPAQQSIKFNKISPHFVAKIFSPSAPIRGSPLFS
ncbi:uncharacterized protein DUF2547 [Pasteurella langaaensis DSM 22999]|uniref:Uncharacterized protein DUF2547 n=2 Tax=Alitibacter langaaensis TaxID=756 RepID=A0A2U0T5D3_9PAST|nr:uncharacterized protein DUF2547 [Pasteurella langaaensis DSM 22999]